ncbi:MAG: rRNA pseudouridine synthase [Clostridia bacterium]|nr:rRNA pseudouridine synthase [Clostridia bacterium]
MELRIQKYISDCGIMSRRAAEREIELGNIKINGEIALIGQKIDPARDTVTYKGKKVRASKPHKTYVMLNKPRGYVTTMSDEKGRKCVSELLSDVDSRVYPIGRLDMNSEGLLLCTDDGELTNTLTHPSHEIVKVYLVRVRGTVDKATLKSLSEPMDIDGYIIKPVPVIKLSENENSTLLRMELSEGRNRQIRKMCEKHELGVLSLKRVSEGDLILGDLPAGKWRYLTREEIKYLQSLVSPKKTEAYKDGKRKCTK